MAHPKVKPLSPQVIVKNPLSGRSALGNLTMLDLGRVLNACEAAVTRSFQRDRGDGMLVLTPNTLSVQLRAEMAWELFQIAYCEKKWNFLRCLDRIYDLLCRKLDSPNWDFRAGDERSMWAEDKETPHVKRP